MSELDAAPPTIADLFADVAAGRPAGMAMSEAAQETLVRLLGEQEYQARLQGNQRQDFAGTNATLLRSAHTYQARVARVWEFYNTDSFFRRLVDRTVDFAANGAMWEVPAADVEQQESWLNRINNWFKGRVARGEREENVWNKWSSRVNRGLPNVLPGMEEITRWGIKHLLLSGMFVPSWKWKEFRYGRQTLLMPMEFTCYNGSSITLYRPNNLFAEEKVFYWRPTGQQVLEGFQVEAPNIGPPDGKTLGQNMIALNLLGESKPEVGSVQSFCVKFNWSPGDLTTLRQGNFSATGMSVYPMPQFYTLMPEFMMRQKLKTADLRILDAIENYIALWKIGDKDHPPVPKSIGPDGKEIPGTIAQVKEMIEQGRASAGQTNAYYLPYYVDLELKIPDTAVLLNQAKYDPSILEMYSAFGIFFARTTAGSRERMERINTSTFEQLLLTLQSTIRSFWMLLASHVVEANDGGLGVPPIWTPYPINTKTEQFQKNILELMDRGRVSYWTVARAHGLDDEIEKRRMAGEVASDTDDMFDLNTPTTFIQRSGPADVGKSPEEAGGDPPKAAEIPRGPASSPNGVPRGDTRTGVSPARQTKGRPPSL